MEFGDGVPVALRGPDNLDDGGDIKMSEIEEGELVEMISKTDLGDNYVLISEAGLHEIKVRSANLDNNESGSKMQRRRKNKKKKKNKNKGNNGTSNPNITDVNRFVINVCKRLREKKSYLVWTAVACLGVSALNDLVQEGNHHGGCPVVPHDLLPLPQDITLHSPNTTSTSKNVCVVDAIQASGGQKTSNGKRFREGGGILWNIIKVREPNAYKEIMKQGKEFEKQLRQVSKSKPGTKEATSHRTSGATTDQTLPNTSDGSKVPLHEVPSTSKPSRFFMSRMPPVRFAPPEGGHCNDIRMPVRYDDLYGEEHGKDIR